MTDPARPAVATPPDRPDPVPQLARRAPASEPVQYKGGDLDPARGPGLGCFYVQLVILVALVVATPLTVSANWPPIVSMGLLIAIIVLLLFTGQTMIFLLRLVAAERGRRRPLASTSPTVGDLEAQGSGEAASAGGGPDAAPASNAPASPPDAAAADAERPSEDRGSVRE